MNSVVCCMLTINGVNKVLTLWLTDSDSDWNSESEWERARENFAMLARIALYLLCRIKMAARAQAVGHLLFQSKWKWMDCGCCWERENHSSYIISIYWIFSKWLELSTKKYNKFCVQQIDSNTIPFSNEINVYKFLWFSFGYVKSLKAIFLQHKGEENNSWPKYRRKSSLFTSIFD